MNRKLDPSDLYRPIVATPFRQNAAYTELAPCDALKPYIRCFWGTPEPIRGTDFISDNSGLVIPDTCMDIIFTLDYARDTIEGTFCAIDENAYASASSPSLALTSTFAIRFYAWTATLFVEQPLNGSKNQHFEVDVFFSALRKELAPMLMSVASLQERARIASEYLLRHLHEDRVSHALMNAVYDMISTRGTMRISELAAKNAISRKQLERVFDEHIGISPKSFSSLIRYQMLWQELCAGTGRSTLDLVGRYGYFDQAHLLNDFKRHHTMTPAQALRFARD